MFTIDLSKVTVVIPTFLRPGYVHNCIASIKDKLPECPIAVACDDGGYTNLSGHDFSGNFKSIRLPFDSGLSAKRNHAVQLVETEYTLIASDDFDFSRDGSRRGVERMLNVLESHKDIDVAVGTYNDKKYEGTLRYVPGEYIAERRLPTELPEFQKFGGAPGFEWDYPYALKIDIGINYFLARTQVLREVPWDENISPIGGEHADWFMMMKDYGKVVSWVPECKIYAFENNRAWSHSSYRDYRWRAATTGHKKFLEKWGVKRYISFDEELPK